jgi:pimeloyl-ACP methyl ester carboxylesterase
MTTIGLILLALVTLLGLLEWSGSPGLAAVWINLERRRAGLRKDTVRIGTFCIPYLHRGRGNEAIVLIHGFGADKDHFTRVSSGLDRSMRVIIPDLPGFGESTRDHDARYRIADQVERLHQFLAKLGVERIHLGGNSMGGFIAAQYAATHPEHVASLWLIDAAGCQRASDNEFFESFVSTGEIPLLVRTLADFDALVDVCVHKSTFIPRSLRRHLARRAANDFSLHRKIFADLFEDSPLLDAQGIRVATPTLIVWGAEDRVLSPACLEDQKMIFPNHTAVVMPDVGHLPMLERPRTVARDYRRFLESIGG